MARYEVFIVQGVHVLDVQTDLIDELDTHVVVPLLPAPSTPPAVRRLHPIFDVSDQRLVMATPLIREMARFV